MTVTYSRMFIETSGLSQKRRVRRTISVGNCICHQKPNFIEKPPAPSKELPHIVVANGVRGMRCTMGSPIQCQIPVWAYHKRIRFQHAWWCWCCTRRRRDGSSWLPVSWRMMCAKQDPCIWQRTCSFAWSMSCHGTPEKSLIGTAYSLIKRMRLTCTNGIRGEIPNLHPRPSLPTCQLTSVPRIP